MRIETHGILGHFDGCMSRSEPLRSATETTVLAGHTDTMRLVRESDIIVVPGHGVRLVHFGVTTVGEGHTYHRR